jgi:hypothetical protein
MDEKGCEGVEHRYLVLYDEFFSRGHKIIVTARGRKSAVEKALELLQSNRKVRPHTVRCVKKLQGDK